MSLRSSPLHNNDEAMIQKVAFTADTFEKMAFCIRMSFDSSSSSMPTPTEMRTSCVNPEKVENLVDHDEEESKLVDLKEEESEVWRNIFQERFDRRMGPGGYDSKQEPFLIFFLLVKSVYIPGKLCQSA